eukprot:scaffold6347_cov124-Isochrysis_galbana.AAC.3
MPSHRPRSSGRASRAGGGSRRLHPSRPQPRLRRRGAPARPPAAAWCGRARCSASQCAAD